MYYKSFTKCDFMQKFGYFTLDQNIKNQYSKFLSIYEITFVKYKI